MLRFEVLQRSPFEIGEGEVNLVAFGRKSVGIRAEIDAELEDEGVELGAVLAVEGVGFPTSSVLFRVAHIGDQVVERPTYRCGGEACRG